MALEQKDRNMAAKDVAFSIALIIFSIYIIVTSLGLKYNTSFIDGAGFFPLIVGCVLLLLGIVLLYVGIRCGGVKRLQEIMNGSSILAFIKSDETVRVVVLVVMMVIYMFILIGRIPFIAATAIYIFVNYLYLGACKKCWIIPGPVMAAIISVVAAVAIYYGMKIGLGITMP